MSNLLDTLDIMVTVGDMDYKKLDIMGMMERMDTLYTGIHWIPRILGYIICTGYIGYKKYTGYSGYTVYKEYSRHTG